MTTEFTLLVPSMGCLIDDTYDHSVQNWTVSVSRKMGSDPPGSTCSTNRWARQFDPVLPQAGPFAEG